MSSLFLNTTVDGIQLGLCYAIAALGMYIAYSVLDFPDLTTDGSFPLGAVITTILIYKLNFNPILALIGGFIVGTVAGSVTGLLHVKLKISNLLSGIIVMTGLMSVTLALTKILTGTGFTVTNFSYTANEIYGLFNRSADGKNIVIKDGFIILILIAVVLSAKLILDFFFKTKIGFMLKATGDNESLVTSLGKNTGNYKILGLAIANGFSALSGGLYAQLTMNYDNTCGSGKVVLALASVIIGISLFSRVRIVKDTTAVIIGAIIYSLCLNYFTLIDTDGTYLKIMNAVCFTLILVLNEQIKSRVKPSAKIEREVH